ncbi:hypothetical protein BJN34_21390 [Cupriavidus necator]|uniref:Uncharacterized protein n=1 Tax=Cupriavidus necator TaxID=106590 RepID=A0A1U9UWA8_CUPNE|nr:hypothetical protein BJN34_21390 [Cupriavidus necator]
MHPKMRKQPLHKQRNTELGARRVGVTSSGRWYLLSGWPCFDGDAERIWDRLAEQYDISEAKDVSMDFMAAPNL